MGTKIKFFPTVSLASLQESDIIDVLFKIVFENFCQADRQESADADNGSDTDQQSADSYLQKGVRLISLAKEKFTRVLKGLEFSDFEQMLYGVKVKGEDYLTAISKAIRLLLRREEVNSPLIKDMLSFLEFEVYLNEVGKEDWGHQYLRPLWRMMGDNDKLLLLQLKEKDFPTMNVYGLKNHTHQGRWKNILYKNGDCVADLAEFLAVLVCVSIIKKILRDQTSEAYADMKSCCKIRASYGTCLVRNGNLSDLAFGGLFHHPFWVDPKRYENVAQAERLTPYLNSKGVTIQYVPSAKKVFDNTKFEPSDIPVIIDQFTLRRLTSYDPWGVLTYSSEPIFHDFLDSKEGRYWAQPCDDRKYELEKACGSFFKEKMQQAAALKELKELANSYARSFEDKKNIPKKTLKAMEESKLNDYFGYVEYDEDVDLTLVNQVIEEFVGVKAKYLPNINSLENAIRFRKLGNHKAIGLYYPSIKCLCVDYRHVHSFIHEYGHLVDYEYGNLSLKGDFSRVKSLYERALRRAMREDERFNARMNSKGKYGLSYFLTPTEIFARSFEVYFSKVLNVESSLIPEVFDREYPITDDEYMFEIKEYFDSKLSILNAPAESEEVGDVAASHS